MNVPTGNPPAYDPYGPPPPQKVPRVWLTGGAAALAVALTGVVGAVVAFGGDGPRPDSRSAVTSSEPAAPAPSGPADDPSATPSPTPPDPESGRVLADVDVGLLVYDDVYVKPADGWKRTTKGRRGVVLTAPGKGAFSVNVATVGVEAATALPIVVDQLIKDDELTAVRKSDVRTVRSGNPNLASQALMDYSGRAQLDSGVTVTISARCTTMTGVESIHEVTVTSCLTAVRADWGAALADSAGMFASVARSI